MDLSKIPLAPNPSGAPPNFVDPPSLDGTLLKLGIFLMVVSAFLISLRLFANLKHTAILTLDDALCLFGWITSSALFIITYGLVIKGSSRHAWDVPVSLFDASYMKRTFAQEIIGTFATWTVKATILTLYIKIFGAVRWLRVAAYATLAVTAFFYIINITVWIAFGVPRPGTSWSSIDLLELSSSRSVRSLTVANGVFGLAVDIELFLLPLPVIMKLQRSQKNKIRLLVVFSFALCSVASACASLMYRVKFFQGAEGDVTWMSMNVILTTTAEQFGTLIVSCAPALSAFLTIVSKSQFYSNVQAILLPHYFNWRRRRLASHNFDGNTSLVPLKDTEVILRDPSPTITAGPRPRESSSSHHRDAATDSGLVMSDIMISTRIEVYSHAL